MLNLTRLHLGIAHESQFQGLGISGRQGCTEAFLLAHGFTLDLLTDMVRAGLATAQIERRGQTRLHITDAGRRALRGKRDAEY